MVISTPFNGLCHPMLLSELNWVSIPRHSTASRTASTPKARVGPLIADQRSRRGQTARTSGRPVLPWASLAASISIERASAANGLSAGSCSWSGSWCCSRFGDDGGERTDPGAGRRRRAADHDRGGGGLDPAPTRLIRAAALSSATVNGTDLPDHLRITGEICGQIVAENSSRFTTELDLPRRPGPFEIDGLELDSGWSVVMQGQA